MKFLLILICCIMCAIVKHSSVLRIHFVLIAEMFKIFTFYNLYFWSWMHCSPLFFLKEYNNFLRIYLWNITLPADLPASFAAEVPASQETCFRAEKLLKYWPNIAYGFFYFSCGSTFPADLKIPRIPRRYRCCYNWPQRYYLGI